MRIPRIYSNAIQLNSSKWLITGGPFQTSTEIYDSKTKTFSSYVDLPLNKSSTFHGSGENDGYGILKVNQTHLAHLTRSKFYLFNR